MVSDDDDDDVDTEACKTTQLLLSECSARVLNGLSQNMTSVLSLPDFCNGISSLSAHL